MYELSIDTEVPMPNGDTAQVIVYFDTYEEAVTTGKIFVEQQYDVKITKIEDEDN